MEKKFELVRTQSIESDGHILYRIRALRDIRDDVHAGDLGGWVEFENNLSQYGSCWIYDDARVYEHGFVCDDAVICDRGTVKGYASVRGSGKITDDGEVYEFGSVIDNAVIKDHAYVHGKACLAKDNVFGGDNGYYVPIGLAFEYDELIGDLQDVVAHCNRILRKHTRKVEGGKSL